MLPVLPSKKILSLPFGAAASGLLLALCFPNFSILPLLPVALIPLVAALDGARPRNAAVLGYVFGLAFWVVTIPWIAYTVHRFGGVSWPVAGLALALAAAICAVPFAVMGLLYAWVAPRSAAGIVATFGAAWVCPGVLSHDRLDLRRLPVGAPREPARRRPAAARHGRARRRLPVVVSRGLSERGALRRAHATHSRICAWRGSRARRSRR